MMKKRVSSKREISVASSSGLTATRAGKRHNPFESKNKSHHYSNIEAQVRTAAKKRSFGMFIEVSSASISRAIVGEKTCSFVHSINVFCPKLPAFSTLPWATLNPLKPKLCA